MSDSDSSSDESSGDGIEIMISNLDSSDYDGHLKIIAKCKKEGELDFLRNGLFVHQFTVYVRWLMLPPYSARPPRTLPNGLMQKSVSHRLCVYGCSWV